MAATERRNGVSRRGMTVLGKVPIVPKPINLPSLRSTFCWDRFSKGEDLSGKYESALVDPVDCNGKLQNKLVTPATTKNHGDGFDLQAKKTQSSRAKSVSTAMRSNNVRKTEETKISGISMKNRKQEVTGPSLQKGGDVASVPPGFSQNGPGNNSKPSNASTHAQSNGVASNVHSETQQSGSQNRNGAKDREIIVIHMVGAPGIYGNFPPYFGFPESHNRNGGVSANFPLQFGNFEPIFGLPGNGASYMPTAAGSEFHDEHEGYICYEKECFKGARHDAGRHTNSWMHGSFRDNTFVGSIHGEAYDPLIHGAEHTFRSRSFSHRHLSRNAGKPRCLYQDGRVVSMEERNCEPMSEKRIMLRTKLHGMQPKSSLKMTGNDKNAELLAGYASSTYSHAELYDDEGKAPIEILEDSKTDEVKTEEASQPKDVSTNLEIMGEGSCSKETGAGMLKVPLSKIRCNDSCLHCKGTTVIVGSPTSSCQSCEKTTVCESSFSSSQCCMKLTEEVPASTALKDSSVDGCKADIKHIILDANKRSNLAVKSVAACQHQETAKENNKYSITAQLSNSEVVDAGTGRLSDTSLNKSERQQKLVYVKKPQVKLTSKSGIRVGKAHVKTKRFRLQDHKLIPAISSISSSNLEGISEVAKQQQENGVQEINSFPTSPLSLSNVSNLGTSSVDGVNEKNERPRKFVYRKRIGEQVTNRLQPRKEEVETNQPVESLPAVVWAEHATEHGENLGTLIPSASGFENHIIEKGACHVMEGSDDHLLSPAASLSSCDNNKKQLEKVEGSKLSTKAASSLNCASESLLLQKSAVEIQLLDSFTKGTPDAVNCSLQSSRTSWSSRQEFNTTKKFTRQLSAWRPKVGCNAAGSGSSLVTEEEEETNFSTSALLGAGEEDTGVSDTGLISDLDFLHPGKTEDKGSLENIQDDLCLQLKSSRDGACKCGENNQLSNHQAELFVQDILYENVSEQNFPQEEVKEPLKRTGELALCSPVVCNSEDNLDLKEVKEINMPEMIAVVSKPFVMKKPMSFEKANQYHQMLFKRYKEIGQWRPKSSLQNKKSIKKKDNVRQTKVT